MKMPAVALVLMAIASAHAVSLDTVLARADSSAAIRWTPDSINTAGYWFQLYGTECVGSDSIYQHCDFVPGVEYQGIAYSYGGEDPPELFRERVADGALIGSHLCHYRSYGDPSDTVTGTDCSGFLSRVWGVWRRSTSMFLSDPAFEKISMDELLPGDALVKANAPCGYHAVLIMEVNDLTDVVIAEATSVVNGCRIRTTDLTQPYWECYTPLRNPAIDRTATLATRRQLEQPVPARCSPAQVSPAPRALYDLHGRRVTILAPESATAAAKKNPGAMYFVGIIVDETSAAGKATVILNRTGK